MPSRASSELLGEWMNNDGACKARYTTTYPSPLSAHLALREVLGIRCVRIGNAGQPCRSRIGLTR